MSHEVIWTQPPAFLGNRSRLLPTPRAAFQAPAILRFATDAFMPEFLGLLETSPERLSEYKVRRETWRGFTPAAPVAPSRPPSMVLERLGIARRRQAAIVAPSPTVTAEVAPAGTPLKLYQPAHQRHYLVACSLVCRAPGLPDRGVEGGRGEQTGWVLRRLLPASGEPGTAVEQWDEYAWVQGAQGAVWQRVGDDPKQVLDGEERLPLFAVHFAENDARRRRLLAGVIPVGKREVYLGAPKAVTSGSGGGVTVRTARKILFRKEVIEPWKAIVRAAEAAHASFTADPVRGTEAPNNAEKKGRLQGERARIQSVSWLILLDFARYLSTYLKPVWRAVLEPSLRDRLSLAERDVFDALETASVSDELAERLRYDAELTATGGELYPPGSVPASLREALAIFGAPPDRLNADLEAQLERVDELYVRDSADRRALWPDFLFPLADPGLPEDAPIPSMARPGALSSEEGDELLPAETLNLLDRLDSLAVVVLRALGDDDPEPMPQPAVPTAAIRPADALEGWFRIRCVYERPSCEPLHSAVVSDPTEPFQLAGFFDPDAPARPIRIGLPIDTTPAGLRKFDKNTAFVISDTLCGQIQRFKGLTLGDLVLSVLPWPFHKDLPSLSEGGPCKQGEVSLGMICSLSIPIVTICALILLMIIVSLLDFVFRWMPYFIVCFPIPGLKAKPAPSATP